jgi:hypothetical protein
MPCAPVAQRLEQQTHNLLVRGSNPCGGTNSQICHEAASIVAAPDMSEPVNISGRGELFPIFDGSNDAEY